MGLELVECTEYFTDTPFRVFQAPYVGAVVMPGGAGQPRKQLDAWQEWAKQRGAKGLAYVLVKEDGELGGPVAKNLTDEERAGMAAHVGAEPGDCIFFAAGAVKRSRALLGAARLEIGRRGGLIDEDAWSFVWVVDAPLFEPAAEATAAGDVAVGSGAWTAVHHAFTSPKDLETFDQDPGNALAWAYDIVCNGNEIGGGSIRIHRSDIQKRVFALMGIDEEAAQEKFGFLLDAFKYGAPPHGGIAFGWDRICALLSRRRLDPRRDRLPEDRWRLRPADRPLRRRSPPSSARRPASTRAPDRQRHSARVIPTATNSRALVTIRLQFGHEPYPGPVLCLGSRCSVGSLTVLRLAPRHAAGRTEEEIREKQAHVRRGGGDRRAEPGGDRVRGHRSRRGQPATRRRR